MCATHPLCRLAAESMSQIRQCTAPLLLKDYSKELKPDIVWLFFNRNPTKSFGPFVVIVHRLLHLPVVHHLAVSGRLDGIFHTVVKQWEEVDACELLYLVD